MPSALPRQLRRKEAAEMEANRGDNLKADLRVATKALKEAQAVLATQNPIPFPTLGAESYPYPYPYPYRYPHPYPYPIT